MSRLFEDEINEWNEQYYQYEYEMDGDDYFLSTTNDQQEQEGFIE